MKATATSSCLSLKKKNKTAVGFKLKNAMRAAQNEAFTTAGSISSRSWSLRDSPLKKALEDREGCQLPFEPPLSLVDVAELQTPQ
ncbi:hypothetical protein EV2_028844 [Malus domestica]